MTIESPSALWKDYELIDSGNFCKLERFGKYTMIRPEPKALWNSAMPMNQWQKMANTEFKPGAGFGKAGKEDSGTWNMLSPMEEQWQIGYRGCSEGAAGLTFRLRLGLTSFKHVGIFPEQAPNWDFIYENTRRIGGKLNAGVGQAPKVLNLFAYTGAASMAARAAGAQVTHLDSVRQVVTWAKGNMEISGLDNIRWVIEDALKFARREAKRGNRYNGLILDPPAYGHGPDGEKWKLDECLFELLRACAQIIEPNDSFMVLNLYSNGYSAVLADTLVRSAFGRSLGENADLTFGELVLRDRFGKALPLSVFSRLSR